MKTKPSQEEVMEFAQDILRQSGGAGINLTVVASCEEFHTVGSNIGESDCAGDLTIALAGVIKKADDQEAVLLAVVNLLKSILKKG